MIQISTPDIVGHLDKVKMHNSDDLFFSEKEMWYREEVLKTLDVIADAGIILEVNTRGIYKKKTTTYPSPWVISMALEKDIPVTINSDAHHPDDLIGQFPETAQLLLETGYSKISVLNDGIWKQFDLTPNGIHF
jgi:histidinol-phosphatase (PHP family)